MGQYSDLGVHNGDLALISKMHATHSKMIQFVKFKFWYVCYDQTHHSMQKFWSEKHLNKKSKFWSKEDLVDKMGLWQNDQKCSEWSDFLTDGVLWSHKATVKIWGHLDKFPSLGGHFRVSVPNRKMHATCSKRSKLDFSNWNVFVMTKHIQPCKNIQVWLRNEKSGLYSFWQGLRKM